MEHVKEFIRVWSPRFQNLLGHYSERSLPIRQSNDVVSIAVIFNNAVDLLGLGLGDTVPDAKTIWLFRELLTEANIIKSVFEQFDLLSAGKRLYGQKGKIVDASIVAAPR